MSWHLRVDQRRSRRGGGFNTGLRGCDVEASPQGRAGSRYDCARRSTVPRVRRDSVTLAARWDRVRQKLTVASCDRKHITLQQNELGREKEAQEVVRLLKAQQVGLLFQGNLPGGLTEIDLKQHLAM